MRALLIAAGLFFSVCGGASDLLCVSGSGHEYDLKLVLPIDTRKMPKPGATPEIVSQIPDEAPIAWSMAARRLDRPRSAKPPGALPRPRRRGLRGSIAAMMR